MKGLNRREEKEKVGFCFLAVKEKFWSLIFFLCLCKEEREENASVDTVTLGECNSRALGVSFSCVSLWLKSLYIHHSHGLDLLHQ